MSEIVGPLSVALVHFLWQGCVIAIVLDLALRLTRNANTNLRYALSVAILGLMVLMPIVTVAYTVGSEAAKPRAPIASPVERSTPAPILATADPVPNAASEGVAVDRAPRAESLRFGIVTLWLIGVLVFTAINTGGWLQIRRLRRSGVGIEDPTWDLWIAELRDRLGIKRLVAVLGSTRVDVPMLLGWVRPVVLVPTSALLGMSPRSLEALLLHELAHIRRHDFFVNLLQAAVETLLFYHPAVWWVSHRVRCEREHCCDDLAVSLCGSRQDYVQALADMERLRLATPKMAVAADGGALVERIRRLTGSSTQRNGGGTRWAVGIGIIVLALTIGAAQFVSFPSANASPAPRPDPAASSVSPVPFANASPVPGADSPASSISLAPAVSGAGDASGDVIEGTWRARVRRGDVWLELHLDGRRSHRNSFSIMASEFSGTGDDGIPGFQLRRDAGSFHFEGKLDGSDRDSRFEFRPNPDYVDRMRSIGFEAPTSARRLYDLAAVDVSLEFAEGIRDAGYGDISIDRLTEFRIHGVTPEFVEAMAETGFEDLSPGRLVEFRIHGVTPEFVKEMADSGFEGLTASRLVEFRIHGVTPEFVKKMADSGFEGLTASRLVEFRIHGVTPEFVREMQDVGLEDLSPSRLVEFRIHGVSAGFVREMAELGLRDISASRLVEMRIHGVSSDFVRSAQSRYGDDLTVGDLIEMRIHDRADAEY